MANKVAIAGTTSSEQLIARSLSSKLELPLVEITEASFPFLLVVTPDRLELRAFSQDKSRPIYVDFLKGKVGYRAQHGGGRGQLIAKAVGIKGNYLPTILDATAGLGEDAFILASLGCEVLMVERSKVVGALLEDGLRRLKATPEGKKLKFSLEISQAFDYINNIFYVNSWRPDVIYLDPMYPERSKSALGKKEMRVLRELVGEDEDAGELLVISLKCARKRVVVKRPRFAKNLGEIKPNLSLSSGKSSRFDIYFTERQLIVKKEKK